MTKQMQKGFTLIELMIVIAIIGILAAIAIPQYQDYVTKSKVSEGPNLAAAVKTAVATTLQSKGSFPQNGNISYGLPEAKSIAGQYVESIEVQATKGIAQGPKTLKNGPLIVVTYHNVGGGVDDGDTLTFTPYVPTGFGSIVWICGTHSVDTPDGDKTGAAGAGTPVPNKFLPSNCY